MTQDEFLVLVARELEASGIPYMVTGPHSSSYYGQPRTTHDVDVIIDPTAEQLTQFLDRLGDRFYASREAAREALERRSMFNIIDFEEGWKIDLIIRKERPFSKEEFRRRQQRILLGHSLPVVSAEDVILAKLEWNALTTSTRQLDDVLQVVKVQWHQLDKAYLRKWSSILGVADKLEEVFETVEF